MTLSSFKYAPANSADIYIKYIIFIYKKNTKIIMFYWRKY